MKTHGFRTRLLLGAFVAGLFFAAPVFADYTVTGKFQYEDREFGLNGFTGTKTNRPIRFADVRIVAGTNTLATGGTNAAGDFSIIVPGSTAQSITAVCVATATVTSGLLLDVRVANDDFSFGDFYSVSSAPVSSPGSGTVSMGTTVAMSNGDAGKTFNVWDVVNDFLQFVSSPSANGFLPVVRLTVIWRPTHSRTGAFFSRGSNKYIFVGAGHVYDDTVIAHEFGHYADNIFSKSDSPGGPHSLGDNNQDIRLSWGEGLATFLGSSSRNFKSYSRSDVYVDTDGTNLNFSYDIESLGGNSSIASKTGSTNEVAVSAVLWDITDGKNTDDGTSGTDDDPLERPFSDVWKVLTRYLITVTTPGISVEDFWDGWFSSSINNGFLTDMQAVFATVNGIEFIADAQEPDDTTSKAPTVGLAQLPVLASSPKVVINEVELGSVDKLELYNVGNVEADLTGWKVIATRPGFTTATLVIPSFKLRAGGIVVLSETSGTNTSTSLFFDINISWSNGQAGACALTDSTGAGKDFVRWGNSTEPPPGGTNFTGTNPASPALGKTLGRIFAGTDTDSGGEWTEQDPTIGSYNNSGLQKRHTFYPTGDVDYVVFNATSGRYYLLETLNVQSGADTVLELLSTDGDTILNLSDDFGAGKGSRLVWVAPSTGKYFLRSRRYNNPLVQYGSYDLQIIEGTYSPGVALKAIFPQVAIGGTNPPYQTSIIAINTSNSNDAPVNISLTKSDGTPLTATASSRTDSFFNLSIPPGGTARLDTTAMGSTVSGYATFLSSVLVDGSAVFKTLSGANVISEAGVGLSKPTKSFTVYVDNLNNALSGYAVANSGSSLANLTLTLRDKNGTTKEIKPLVLPAGQHFAEFAFQRFPANAAAGFEGSIEFTSDLNVTAVALRYDNTASDVFSTIPVLVDEAATTLYFPQVADGGGYRTNFILVNPSGTATSAKLEFFADDGTPLGLPLGGVVKTSHDLPLSAKGVARFITDGTSSGIKVGWVRVTCPAAIGGSSIFQTVSGTRITSEAGVASSPVATHFTTYVSSLGFTESGLAICNTNNSSASITLRLRDTDGTVVSTTSFTLPALGHVARFFTQWFPFGFPDFEGTLEVVASAPVSGVALRYDNQAADVFATLPVVVLP